MIFAKLPQQQHFYLNGELYYKICPIYSSCCTVKYNAKGTKGYILIGEEQEIVPQDPNVQPLPDPPEPVFPVSNLFVEGAIMLLRRIPMNARFIAGTEIYKRVGADRVQKEGGEIIIMNKNTPCELLGDIEDTEDTEDTENTEEIEQVEVVDDYDDDNDDDNDDNNDEIYSGN